MCKMSRGMKVEADASIEDVAKEEFDMIVCPGGMPGAAHLRDSKTLISMLKNRRLLINLLPQFVPLQLLC